MQPDRPEPTQSDDDRRPASQPSRLQQLLDGTVARDTRRHHTLEYRVSFPTLFWGSYYLAVFAGPERRNPLRLAAEGQTALGRQARFVGCVLLLSLSLAFFGLFCALYLFKSAVGIELFSGQSPFHPLFELFLTSWNASVAKLQS